jgi:hypothetical protein
VKKFTIYYENDGTIGRYEFKGYDLFDALTVARNEIPYSDIWNCKAVLITREEIKNDNAEVQ